MVDSRFQYVIDLINSFSLSFCIWLRSYIYRKVSNVFNLQYTVCCQLLNVMWGFVMVCAAILFLRFNGFSARLYKSQGLLRYFLVPFAPSGANTIYSQCFHTSEILCHKLGLLAPLHVCIVSKDDATTFKYPNGANNIYSHMIFPCSMSILWLNTTKHI